MAEATLAADQALARRAAQMAVVEARSLSIPSKHYLLAIKQLPLLIRQHGLGQSLTYLNQRGGGRDSSPFSLVLKQIDRLLGEAFQADANSLKLVTQHDSFVCVRAIRLIEMFLSQLIPLAERLA